MSIVTHEEMSSVYVDCLDCNFTVTIDHEHDDLHPREFPPGDERASNVVHCR